MARMIKPGIETGDPEFDDLIRIEGDRDFALDLLDEGARRAALDGLVEAKALDELLNVEPMGEPPGRALEAETLARALGRLGDVHAQPRLLALLEDSFDEDPDERTRTAAATALGVVGNAQAVEPLRRAAGSRPLVRSPLARAVETAIQQIQSRLGGSQAGEISLATASPLEGAVSPAHGFGGSDESGDSRRGEVSLAEEPSTTEDET